MGYTVNWTRLFFMFVIVLQHLKQLEIFKLRIVNSTFKILTKKFFHGFPVLNLIHHYYQHKWVHLLRNSYLLNQVCFKIIIVVFSGPSFLRSISLLRNKSFMLDEMTQWRASKFDIFWCIVIFHFIHVLQIFP